MVTITKNGNSVVFEFDDSQHYLQGDGTIEVPVNSLALVLDESDMATFKKASSNDIFVSFKISDSNFSDKDELLQFYKENMVGSTGGGGTGSGVTEEEVAEMIGDALEDYYDKDEVDAGFSAITEDIEENEYVISQAINEIKDKVEINELVTASALTEANNSYKKVSGITIYENLDNYPEINIHTEQEGEELDVQLNNYGINSYLDDMNGNTYESFLGAGSLGNHTESQLDEETRNTRSFNITTDGFAVEYNEFYNDGVETEYSPRSTEMVLDYNNGLEINQTFNDGENETNNYLGLINNGDSDLLIEMSNSDETLQLNPESIITNEKQIRWDEIATTGDIREVEEVTAAALNQLNETISGKADVSAVTAVQQSLSGKQDTLVSGTNIKTINNQSLLGSGNITISGGGGSYVYYTEDTSGKTANIHIEDTEDSTQGDLFVYADGTQMTGSRNDSDEGIEYNTNINVAPESIDITYEKNTGDETTNAHSYLYVNEDNISMEVYANDNTTQFAISNSAVTINGDAVATEPYVDAALSGKAETSAVTAISDALSGYVQTSAITTAVTSASTDSEIPSAKAVYEAIPTGGTGGATYSAGTNISIDSANTINCTLNIQNGSTTGSAGSLILTNGGSTASGNRSIAGGQSSSAAGENSIAFGNNATINQAASSAFSFGRNTESRSSYETSLGAYNVSNRANFTFGNSGNTLFSVGNGTSSARHNAFEIRQNGDIYISSGGTDIKLQDHLGGSITTTSAVTSGSTDAVESGAVYEAMGGLKLRQVTQAEYDAMVSGGTLDATTLYVITSSNS